MNRETHTWHGKVCSNCKNGFEMSPTNAVSVKRFEFCPTCGEDSTLHTVEIEKPLDSFIGEYLEKEYFNGSA